MPVDVEDAPLAFRDLGLSDAVLRALDAVGYEAPSPIQARTIPVLLSGRDLLGQAQTGTGKTGAFALPLIDRLDIDRRQPQVLVLTPTRELAIQVAEAFQRYASGRPGFHVLPVYGGQPYPAQERGLKRGPHVIVGTPGRVMDHMRRKSLDLKGLSTIVLDEADEMLAMGFLEDVGWILEQAPEQRQVALFSATMPSAVRRIAQQHLRDPAEVTIELRTRAAETIRQRHLIVPQHEKIDALTRLLEVEPFDAMLIFVRTKTATVELAEKLEARGHAAEALNGDIPQAQRERVVQRLKAGRLDLLVATDVAARGLDVDRISHVLNYDIPHDTEAYIHRIGRTGRAGRTGEAILFVTPRERRMLGSIESSVGQPIEAMTSPTTHEVNTRRIERFKARITAALDDQDLSLFERLVREYAAETGSPMADIAAALAFMAQGDQPLLMVEPPPSRKPAFEPRQDHERKGPPRPERPLEEGMRRYRIQVGHSHGVKAGQIVGAIAGESGIDGKRIGRIDIRFEYTLVDLPDDMTSEGLAAIGRAKVCRQRLAIALDRGPTAKGGKKPFRSKARPAPPPPGGFKPPRRRD